MRPLYTRMRAVILVAVMLVAASLSYYAYISFYTPPGESVVKVGVLAPLTGPFAAGGTGMSNSLELAAEDINAEGGVLGRKLVLITYDTEGKPDTTRTQALRLIDQDNVAALLGAYLSEETVVVEEVAAERRVPLIVPIAATLEVTEKVMQDYTTYRYIFRVAHNITQWAHLLGAFIASEGVENYAFVGVDIRWNREFATTLEAYLRGKGTDQVFQGFYSPQNPVMDALILAVKERNPELVVLGDPGRNAVVFVKKARDSGLDAQLLSVGGSLADKRVVETLERGSYLFFQAVTWEGVTDRSSAYFEKFRERYGYTPVGYSDTLPYDSLRILAQAFNKAGSTEAEKVILVLERSSFEGIAGDYRFNAAHQAVWAPDSPLSGVVVRWVNGEGVVVWPSASP